MAVVPLRQDYVSSLSRGKLNGVKVYLSVSANDELETKQSKWTAVVNKLITYSKLRLPQILENDRVV